MRTPERRARLLRVLVAVHRRRRPPAAPAVIDFQRLLVLWTVVEAGRAGERASRLRRRHLGQHRARDLVEPIRRDDIAGERIADEAGAAWIRPGGERIVDGDARLREIAGALAERREREHIVARALLLVIVLAEPEEGLVRVDRTADRSGPRIVVLRGVRSAGPLGEEQLAGTPSRLVHKERAAVPRVRP